LSHNFDLLIIPKDKEYKPDSQLNVKIV
jgi:hypothetical protein